MAMTEGDVFVDRTSARRCRTMWTRTRRSVVMALRRVSRWYEVPDEAGIDEDPDENCSADMMGSCMPGFEGTINGVRTGRTMMDAAEVGSDLLCVSVRTLQSLVQLKPARTSPRRTRSEVRAEAVWCNVTRD